MKRAAARGLDIDVVVESDLWKQSSQAAALLRRAVGAAAAALSTSDAELAIVLTDDSAIRLLNRDWRGVDAATNVLSFPAPPAGGSPRLLGDIVLAHETIAREARAQDKPFAHHLAHLAIHGFLHLLGYDHERTADAEEMEGLERAILRRLRIANPYELRRPRAAAPTGPRRRERMTRIR